mgnify:CR=1 FL=1
MMETWYPVPRTGRKGMQIMKAAMRMRLVRRKVVLWKIREKDSVVCFGRLKIFSPRALRS